jgi:hypothetical protein
VPPHKIPVVVIVEKELGDDKIAALINLAFGNATISGLLLRMPFRIASHCDSH